MPQQPSLEAKDRDIDKVLSRYWPYECLCLGTRDIDASLIHQLNLLVEASSISAATPACRPAIPSEDGKAQSPIVAYKARDIDNIEVMSGSSVLTK